MQALTAQVQVLQRMKQFAEAIEAAKTLLLVTWFAQSIPDELAAYELLARQYYYNNQLSKSAYYQDRFMRGKFESNQSETKSLCCSNYKARTLTRSHWDHQQDFSVV